MNLKIYKMSGAGNLFTVFDNRNKILSKEKASELTPVVTNKNDFNSFITEGFLLLESSEKYDFKCEFFNPDGSNGMMCGNGGRAISRFAKEIGMISKNTKKVEFEMAGDVYNAEFIKDNIRLTLPKPTEINTNLIVETELINFVGTYVNVGSDHFIVDIDKLKSLTKLQNKSDEDYHDKIENKLKLHKLDIDTVGPSIRYNKVFDNGCNANFIEIQSDKLGEFVKLRTYERGVEEETGACGTGAVSTAIHCALTRNMSFPIRISPTSNEELIIDCIGNFPDNIKNMILEGGASIIDESLFEF